MSQYVIKVQKVSQCFCQTNNSPEEVVAIMHDRVVVITVGEGSVLSTLLVEVVDVLCQSIQQLVVLNTMIAEVLLCVGNA